MKRGRFTEEQIIAVLLRGGAGRRDWRAGEHGISEATCVQLEGASTAVDVSEAKRLRNLKTRTRNWKTAQWIQRVGFTGEKECSSTKK